MDRTTIKKCFSSEVQPLAPGFEELSPDGRVVKKRHKVTTGVNLKYYEFILTLEKICSDIATVPENAYSSVIQELFRTLANYRVLICDPMANMLVDALQRLSELNIIYVLKQTELVVMNIMLPETVKNSDAIHMFAISLRLLVLNMIVCGFARRDLHNAISFSTRERSTLDYELDVQCATMHTQSNHCCLCIAENYPKRDIDVRGADLILDDVRKEFVNYSRIRTCKCVANSNLCEQCLCSLRESLYLTYIFYKFEDEKKSKSIRDKNAELRIFKAKSLAKRDARLRATAQKINLETAGTTTPPVLDKRVRLNLTKELLETTADTAVDRHRSQKIVYEDSNLQLRVRKSGAIRFKRKSANGYDEIVILGECKEPPKIAQESTPVGSLLQGKIRRGRLIERPKKVSRKFIDKLMNDLSSKAKKRSTDIPRMQRSTLCAKKPGLAQRFVKVISTALLNNERLLNESVIAELCNVVLKLRGLVLEMTRCHCEACKSTVCESLSIEDMRPIILALFLHNEILNNNFLMDICNDKMFMSLQMPRRSAYKMYFNIVDNRKSIVKDKLAEARTRIQNVISSLMLYDASKKLAKPITLCFAIRKYGAQLHDMYRLDFNGARDNPVHDLVWLKTCTKNDSALFLYKSEKDFSLTGQASLEYNTAYHTYSVTVKSQQGNTTSFSKMFDPWLSAAGTSVLRQGPAVTSRTLNRYNKMRNRPKYAAISGVVVKSVKRDFRGSGEGMNRKRRSDMNRGKEGIMCCQATVSELEATILQIFDSMLLGHLLRVYCNILSNQIECNNTDYRGFYDQFHYLNGTRPTERYESDIFVLIADRTFKATEKVLIEDTVLLRNKGPLSMKNIPRVVKYYARSTLDAFTKFEFNSTLIVLFRPTGNNYFVIQFENDRSIIVQHIAKCVLVELVCKDPLSADAPLTATERYFENADNALFSKNEVIAIRDFLNTDNTLPKTDNSYSTLMFLVGDDNDNESTLDEAIQDCERIAEVVMKVKTVAITDRCASIVFDKIFEAAWNLEPVSFTRQIDERTLACVPAHDTDVICTWTTEERTTLCTATKYALVFVGRLMVMSDYNVLDIRLLDCFRRRISVLKCSTRAGVIIPLNRVPSCEYEVASFLKNGINHVESYRYIHKNITAGRMLVHDNFAVMYTATTTALHLSLDDMPAIKWKKVKGMFHGRHSNSGFLTMSANKLLLAVYAATVIVVNTYHKEYFTLKSSLLITSGHGLSEVNFIRLKYIVRKIVFVDGYVVSKESQRYDYKKLISLMLIGEQAVLLMHQGSLNNEAILKSVGHYHRSLHVLYVYRKLIDYFTSQYSDMPMECDPTVFMLNIVSNAKKFISNFETKTVIRVPLRCK
uniref:Uncharacterized protein U10 n=1 Tax=Hyposoter didymator TaxID=260305 RepID=D7P5N4_HYPDD|nr:unknown [Hyposoter didymator]